MEEIKKWFKELNYGQCVKQTRHLGIIISDNPKLTAEKTVKNVKKKHARIY